MFWKWTSFAGAVLAGAVVLAAPVDSMLGAEESKANAENWQPTAADYIQDGLIAMWDGIENVGWGEHDSEATEWVDLVSGNSYLLANGIHFDDNCAYTDSEFASSSWFSINHSLNTHTRSATVVCENMKTSGNNLVYSEFYSRKLIGISTEYVAFGLRQAVAFEKSTIGEFVSISANYINPSDSTALEGFINNKGYNSFKYIDFSTPASHYGAIGGGYNGARYFQGNLYNVRLYERMLTPKEIEYNYMVDRARFCR